MSNKQVLLVLFVVLIFGIVWLWAGDQAQSTKHPEVDFSISCVECHTEVTPQVVKDWKGSMHGKMNFGCYMCHGDGQVEFFPKPGSERCIACHSGKAVDFSKTPVKNCFDCHKGHTLKFHSGD